VTTVAKVVPLVLFVLIACSPSNWTSSPLTSGA
jgi:hypothetical protein